MARGYRRIGSVRLVVVVRLGRGVLVVVARSPAGMGSAGVTRLRRGWRRARLGLRVKVKGSKAAGVWALAGPGALVGRLVVVGALVVGVLVGLVAGPVVVVVDSTVVVVVGTVAAVVGTTSL
jgi:hypothetical protein